MLLTVATLCVVAFAAGFVDAVVGGGGLLQLPALLVLLPGVPIPTLFGTSKLSGMFGTGFAAVDFARRKVPLNWRILLPAAAAGATMSWFGAHAVSRLPREALRPMVLFLMIGVAIYSFIRKDFGALRGHEHPPRVELALAILGGATLGFYDGFFGPGAGSLLIFFFIGVLGYDFLMASAAAKVLNIGSNLTAMSYFAWTGQVVWQAGLPMAACNVAGAKLGTWMAVRRGTAFVRPLFIVMVVAAILRVGWDLLHGAH